MEDIHKISPNGGLRSGLCLNVFEHSETAVSPLTVVSLTAYKFQPLTLAMHGFSLSDVFAEPLPSNDRGNTHTRTQTQREVS
jgi:hypothetical protein